MKKGVLGLIIGFLCVTSSIYSQQIVYLHGVSNVTWRSGIGYDPVTNTSYFETDPFQIENTSGSSSDYTVFFSEGGNSSGSGSYNRRAVYSGNQYINYQLYSTQTANDQYILKDFSGSNLTIDNAISNNSDSSKIDAGSTINKNYYIYVPAQQFIYPGTYTDTIDVKIYKKRWDQITSDTDSLEQTLSITLTFVVQSALSLTLQVSSLDFGEAESNKSKTFTMNLVSNTLYNLTVLSQKDGALKHENNNASLPTIPYYLKFNGGSNLTMSTTATTLAQNAFPTLSTGFTLSNEVVLGTVTDANLAGSYSDVLTFEIKESF